MWPMPQKEATGMLQKLQKENMRGFRLDFLEKGNMLELGRNKKMLK
jgi:hypothetical protein